MRYLVVLPPNRHSAARFHDLECEPVTVGDEVLVNDLLVRVQSVVDVPADNGYDATIVCTASG